MNGRRSLILIGAGGHAKVLLALATAAGLPLAGVCRPGVALPGEQWRGIAVLGDDTLLASMDPASAGLVNGVGQVPGSALRSQLFDRYRLLGFAFPPLQHPAAWVSPGVLLGEGVQVMAGAVIQPDTQVGANTIINSRASIDHDCRIGSHVHVAPGAILCGNVVVDDGAFIGAGATVIQGIRIGAGAVVGAGTVVLRDLAPGACLLGAKPVLKARA